MTGGRHVAVRPTDAGPGERGGIISSWMLQLALIMTVVGLVGYEAVAIVVETVSLEDTARTIAVATADAYGLGQDLAAARSTADEEATRLGVAVTGISVEGELLRVTIEGRASTLFVHKIGFLEGLTRPTATGRSNWRL